MWKDEFPNIIVFGNRVIIDGVEIPPCPRKGHNSTVINGKIYLNGYEWKNGKWRVTIKSIWHLFF